MYLSHSTEALLSSNCVSTVNTQQCAKLCNGSIPCLFANFVTDEDAASFCHASGPLLQSLMLSRSCLNSHAVAHLTKARWAVYEHLHRSFNDLTCQAIPLIAKAEWLLLTCLDLSGIALMYGMLEFSALVMIRWSALESLDLSGIPPDPSGSLWIQSSLDNTALICLVNCRWPCLISLNVRRNIDSSKEYQYLFE